MAASAATKPKLPSWSLPVLCVGISVLVHLGWSVPGLSLPSVQDRSEAPDVVLLQGNGRTEWMPVMFSLPSLDGFSGVVRRLDTSLTPPLTSPVDMAGPTAFDPLAEMKTPALPAFPLAQEKITVFGPTPDSVASSPVIRPGWSLRFPDRPDLRVVLIRDPRIQNPERAVRLVGEMRFDSFGRLQNVFVEPHDLTAQVMQNLMPDVRQVGISPREAPGRFRFELTFTPDTP